MNIRVTIIVAIGLGLFSCEKEINSEKIDYRNEIVGNYIGIRVNTSWINTVGWDRDTSDIVVTLSKSRSDSIIDISFDPDYWSSTQFSFKYKDGQFKATTYYHAPTLSLSNDSLYFFHQPGLGPIWMQCFTIRIE